MKSVRDIDRIERDYKKHRLRSVLGNAEMFQTPDGIAIHVKAGVAASCGFLCISKIAPQTIEVSEGYGCYGGTFTKLSDGDQLGVGLFGSNTVYDYDGASGTWYTCAKINFASGVWTFEMNDTVDTLPSNTDSEQYYILGKVTVETVGPIQEITAVQQYWAGGWCIYENRV